MSISLVKGQKIDLTKGNSGLRKVAFGLGWDTNRYDGNSDFDLDVSAFLTDDTGKVTSEKDFVFYGQPQHPSGALIYSGDNLTGDGDGDDEQITVDLAHLSSEIERIVFVVNIYNCTERKQDFGLIKNAYIRLVDESTGKEICKYNLSDDYAGKTAMIFAEVYRNNGEWKFNAIGQGTNDASISQLINRYR